MKSIAAIVEAVDVDGNVVEVMEQTNAGANVASKEDQKACRIGGVCVRG